MSNSTNQIAPKGPALEFRNVTIRFDDVVALQNLSFTLAQNEMLFVTGASASGKSVLLRLAMGMLKPDEGQVFVQGREISAMEDEDLLLLRSELMGIVFQDEALFTALNVYDNTAYRLVEHGWKDEDARKSVMEILQFVGLDNELEKTVAELSGGMKRRLELARALVGWPSLMLFDEPTTGLDPINARAVRDLIIRARDLHQMSSVYVSKAMNEIPYVVQHFAETGSAGEINIKEADDNHRTNTRVMVLDAGQMSFLGSYEEFAHSHLHAITQLLHPQPSAVNDDYHSPDPWAHDQNLLDKML